MRKLAPGSPEAPQPYDVKLDRVAFVSRC